MTTRGRYSHRFISHFATWTTDLFILPIVKRPFNPGVCMKTDKQMWLIYDFKSIYSIAYVILNSCNLKTSPCFPPNLIISNDGHAVPVTHRWLLDFVLCFPAGIQTSYLSQQLSPRLPLRLRKLSCVRSICCGRVLSTHACVCFGVVFNSITLGCRVILMRQTLWPKPRV